MRAVAHSFLAALIVVALFWGNCFSCPQVLLALTTHAHACCKHQKASPEDCRNQALQNFVQGDTHAPVQMPAAVLPPAVAPALSAPAYVARLAVGMLVASPPELEVLNSSFRI